MKYLIGLIALALPTYLVRFNIGGIPTTLLELIIYAVFLYSLFAIGYCQWLKVKRKVWLPIAILLFSLVLSTYIAPDKLTALGEVKGFFIDPLLVFWMMICFLDPKDLIWSIYGLTGSGLFVSIYTIVQKILGEVTSDGRVIGIFGYSPNYLSLFLTPVAVLLLSYAYILYKKKKLIKMMVFLGFVIINLMAIYFSGSRGGLLAFLGGAGFLAILSLWEKIKSKLWLKIALIATIIVVVFGAWWMFRPDFSQSSGRVTTSNNLRFQIWDTTLELGMQNVQNVILGVGLGNFQNAFSELTKDRVNFPEYISPMALTPHNVFLTFWLTTGVLGLIAFIWLLIIFYRTGVGYLAQSNALILLPTMTAIILQGLVDTPYFKNDLSVLFWLIFGFMILLKKEEK